MYTVPAFRSDDLASQHALIRARPLGLLVTCARHEPVADALPFLLDAEAAPLGVLRAHLARANPQCDALSASGRALAIFQDVEGYVTPSWYPSKQDHGRVVPTWNYGLVQVHGAARLVDDRDWLRAHVDEMTRAHEARRPAPWGVADAPEEYIDGMLRQIVGLEIVIERIEAKWKVSQNRSARDQAGVAAGLREIDTADALRMARLVEAGGPRGS